MLTLHPDILVKNGKKQFAVLPYEEFLVLQERLADAEDLLELRKAKRAEGKTRSISLAEVKRQLGAAYIFADGRGYAESVSQQCCNARSPRPFAPSLRMAELPPSPRLRRTDWRTREDGGWRHTADEWAPSPVFQTADLKGASWRPMMTDLFRAFYKSFISSSFDFLLGKSMV